MKEFHARAAIVRGHVPRVGHAGRSRAAADDRVGAGGRRRRATSSSYAQKPRRTDCRSAGKVQRLAAKDIAKQPSYEGDFKYAGVDDNYFMTVALAPGAGERSPISRCTIPRRRVEGSAARSHRVLLEPKRATPPSSSSSVRRTSTSSRRSARDMTRAINFGMFAVIVVPLLRSLKWVNGYVGNYGWSIVVLTMIINIVMFPLQHKSSSRCGRCRRFSRR